MSIDRTENLLRASKPPMIESDAAHRRALELKLREQIDGYAQPEPLAPFAYLRLVLGIIALLIPLIALQRDYPEPRSYGEVYGRPGLTIKTPRVQPWRVATSLLPPVQAVPQAEEEMVF